jgi:serine/threonine-protein kinase HipA
MSVGNGRHYKIEDIRGRHFMQTAVRAGLPASLAGKAMDEVAKTVDSAMKKIESQLPPDFPEEIHASVQRALKYRLHRL